MNDKIPSTILSVVTVSLVDICVNFVWPRLSKAQKKNLKRAQKRRERYNGDDDDDDDDDGDDGKGE